MAKDENAAQANLRQVVGDVLEGWTLPDGVRKLLEAAYYADPTPVFRGPAKFTAEEVADGYRGIRWITAAGVYGRPSNCDVRDYLTRTPSMNTRTCDACKAFYAAQQSAHPECMLTDDARDAARYRMIRNLSDYWRKHGRQHVMIGMWEEFLDAVIDAALSETGALDETLIRS